MKGIETLKALIDGKSLVSDTSEYIYKIDKHNNKLICVNKDLILGDYMKGAICESVLGFNDVLMTEFSIKSERRFDFSAALCALKRGRKVSRDGWNGKGQYIEMQKPDINSKMTKPYLYIKTVDGSLVPWTPSQVDMFADDWYEVE